MPKSDDKVGALWIKQQRGGGEHLSGEVTIDGHTVRVVVFRNSYKTEVNRQPDYIIYRDAPLPPRPDGESNG